MAEEVRFFDNRQRYLLFVTTTNEKAVIAEKLSHIINELKPIYELSFYYSDENKRQGYGTYISSGLSKKINLTNSLFLLPSFSAGLYREFDDGKDMGYPLEFKSEVELNFKILNSSIIGVSYSHISNADIGNKNPGSDNILFNFRLSENF